MSAVETIKEVISRIKSAKEKLKSWLTNAGVTVPDGTKLDGMVEMLDDVSVSGGDDSEYIDGGFLFARNVQISIDKIYTVLKKIRNFYSMEWMFQNCTQLNSVDLSFLNTNKVEKMNGLFGNCSKITELNMSGFDTRSVKNMASMFSGCSKLKHIDLSSFDTSKTEFFGSMFEGCSMLTEIDVSGFDTSNAVNMYGMFSNCSMLEELDLSSFDTSNVTKMNNMFYGCQSLKNLLYFSAMNGAGLSIYFPKGSSSKRYSLKRLTFRNDLPDGKYAIRSAVDISYCSMERSGFLEMIGTITDVSALGLSESVTKIAITGNPCVTGTLSDGTACDVLNDEDRSIATAKGWTLVE